MTTVKPAKRLANVLMRFSTISTREGFRLICRECFAEAYRTGAQRIRGARLTALLAHLEACPMRRTKPL